jgi:hypothetical protein
MVNPAYYPKKKTLVFKTNWLSSIPIFYNLKNRLASTKINEVIPKNTYANFHFEGLKNFLDYGYSVFGQTPIENVKFLSPESHLFRYDDGKLAVEKMPDPVEKWIDYTLSENDIIDLIQERVRSWEASLPYNQEIVLPLSSGFDSRLLLWCLLDKSKVRAYTYGLSKQQDQSIEIIYARELAKRFKLNWQQVYLGEFHTYFDKWDKEFGLSIHAHGMYHFEFYNNIRENLKGEQALLSGIIGDAWSGSVLPVKIKTEKDLLNLSYSHGLIAKSKFLKLPTQTQLREQFFIDNKEKLSDHRFQIITMMRFKIILLSYLISVPSFFKFKPWSPFLEIDIAMAMLNLPKNRRINRQWQRDFFKKVGLDLENQNFKSDRTNSLDFQAMTIQRLKPFNVELLSQLFKKDYIKWINKNIIINPLGKLYYHLLNLPKIGSALRRLGVKNVNLEAYYSYLCLKPIEKFLERNR